LHCQRGVETAVRASAKGLTEHRAKWSTERQPIPNAVINRSIDQASHGSVVTDGSRPHVVQQIHGSPKSRWTIPNRTGVSGALRGSTVRVFPGVFSGESAIGVVQNPGRVLLTTRL
jgi:hypothetical protein